ncbi:hypothetical protein [Streptomyces sp. NPDC006739]|uniref:hypothetical protein n=1 Tax=Streptomyces sp. NPDC006739 TaxID=3364763 RepID=UPI003684D1E8
MGSLRLTLCTAILALAALAPTAYAAGGDVSVTPSSPAPGSDVTLTVRGCSGVSATAVSTAFVADARLTGGSGTLTGESRVRSSLTPGAYDVKVDCADSVVTGSITVGGFTADGSTVGGKTVGGRTAAGDTVGGRTAGRTAGLAAPRRAEPSADPATPVTPATPTAPVRAGGGGTAPLALVDAHPTGPDAAQAVTGLVLAGGAAAAVALLGARRSRGTK